MGLLTWLRLRPPGAPEGAAPGNAAPESAASESGAPESGGPLREAQGATGGTAGQSVDPDDAQWRRLSGDGRRDLTPMTQARMRKLSLHLWESNLLAKFMIEVQIAFVLAEGAALKAENEDAQGWLDAFWTDPINRMDLKLPRKLREYKLFGEQCWPVFVNPSSGHVRLGYLDPEDIEAVVTDPDNAEQPILIQTVRDEAGNQRTFRVIVNGPERIFGDRARRLRAGATNGDCFYFAKNSLSNGRRGRSDLLAATDYLDGYDQALFGELERAGLLRSFVWDVTMQGATQDDVDDKARALSAPQSGGVRVHNESEQWQALSPDLQAADTSEAMRLFRNHTLGGQGIPEHWFGGGGDVNRATAGEMSEPILKLLTMEQNEVKYILEEIGTYVVRRRLDPAGTSDFDPADLDGDLKPVAEMPEMSARDVSGYAGALQQVVAASAAAVDRGLMTDATAVRLIQAIAQRIGVEVDADAELAQARQDQAARAEADSFAEPPDETDPPEGAGGAESPGAG